MKTSKSLMSISSALCFHCSRNLCLDHLTEHAQLVDALTRSILEENFRVLNDLSTRLSSLMISSKIVKEPFVKLEQWRVEAYQQIDQIVQKKNEEIRTKIEEYRVIFDKRKKEQLEKIVRYKQKISELFRQSQVANRDLSTLKKSIEKLQKDLEKFDQHSIDLVSNPSFMHSLHIQLKLDPWKSSSSSSSSSTSSSISSVIHQLEFRLKFIRRTGFVTSHYVLVPINGTMADLMEQFTRNEGIKENFLATEVCQYRVRRRLNNAIQLRMIFNQISELVLYETPMESNGNDLQEYCWIFCQFENGLPWDILFRLPILLHVPRCHCRGLDIINALNQTLKNSFPVLIENTDIHYEVKIRSDDDQISLPINLNQWADEVIDEHLLMAENATLIVNVVYQNQLNIDQQTKHLARLDGIRKNSDKRRKSRK